MPRRNVFLATGEIYHVFNRGVNHQPIFRFKKDYQRAVDVLAYYQYVQPALSFSKFNSLTTFEKLTFWKNLQKQNQKLVTILTFCLMPNHFHLLLRQETDNGISKFMANYQNSLTKYINTRHERTGHLFQGQFKAVRVETQEQLLHTSRYIHLNPYTSFVVKSLEELCNYPWSSLPEFISWDKSGICETETIISNFPSRESYLQFVLDQKEYQRVLDQIKHLVIEK